MKTLLLFLAVPLLMMAGCDGGPRRNLEVVLGTAMLTSDNHGANASFGKAVYETVTDPNGVTRTTLTVTGYELAMQEAYQAYLEAERQKWVQAGKLIGAAGAAALAGGGL